MTLKWTHDTPTEPGLYLYRKSGCSTAHKRRVICSISGWAWCQGEYPWQVNGYEACRAFEWAGPIPEPEEDA